MTDRSFEPEVNEVLAVIHGDVACAKSPETFTEAFWSILESEHKSARLLRLVRELQLKRNDIDREAILTKAEKHGLTALHVEELAAISTDQELCETILSRVYPEIIIYQDTPTDEKPSASIPSTHLPNDRQNIDVGLAMALSDDGTPQTAHRWNVSVRRREATVDTEETSSSGETASVRILWTSEETLQIGLSDFLLPTADQKVQILWISKEKDILSQAELSSEEATIATLLPAARQPVAGDRLLVRKLNQDRLLLEIDITPTDWK